MKTPPPIQNGQLEAQEEQGMTFNNGLWPDPHQDMGAANYNVQPCLKADVFISIPNGQTFKAL